MLYFNPWKVIVIIGISLASILLSLPNAFTPQQLENLPSWMQRRMPLGLDLQGGAYLLLEMSTDDLRKRWIDNLAGDVRKTLRDEKIGYSGIASAKEEVRVTIRDNAQVDAAYAKLRTLARPTVLLFGGEPELEITREGNIIGLKPTASAITTRLTDAMGAAIETVRMRVDPSGTKEILIQKRGSDRILLEVPGLKDTHELRELLSQTAALSFHLVDQSKSIGEAKAGDVPPGSALYKAFSETDEGAGGQREYLLQKYAIVEGKDLVSARSDFDQSNQPVVSFRFNPSGAQRFGKVTSENVGKPFAIILDDKVISAPVIREPILGGSGQISGNFSVAETEKLAVLLRSGALPAKLTVVEERSVGASLGADAIKSGSLATMVAFALVTVFMVVGYGLFGAFSIVALIVNLTLVIACLSLIHATLTLPGIAGMALTIGVAVDANVLIYERMREELRAGKSNIAALDAGFRAAYATIINSHLTGLLGGIILWGLGVGPIRGFAVTLCIGIVASLFTSITLTRLIIAAWVRWARPTVIPL